jgi:hypothetical protein
VLGNPVAVEKHAFLEKSRNLGDRKCLGEVEKSFVELPDASNFCEFLMTEFFNSHRDYHHQCHFEIAGGKRISQHLSGRSVPPGSVLLP